MADLGIRFEPDWVSPPGETISELLEERGWSQDELAQRIDYSAKHVSQLINGRVPLTDDAAVRLSSVLGVSVGFWLTREAQYRERLARHEARARFAAWHTWLERIPVRQLMDLRKIDKCRVDARSKPAIVEQCLAFFGVASPDGWATRYGGLQMQFRRSREEQSDLGAISAWLRRTQVQRGAPRDAHAERAISREIQPASAITFRRVRSRMRVGTRHQGIACQWRRTLA
jgi:HTH-type transcriptional regulator/antitoxin HigA